MKKIMIALVLGFVWEAVMLGALTPAQLQQLAIDRQMAFENKMQEIKAASQEDLTRLIEENNQNKWNQKILQEAVQIGTA